MPTIGDMTFRSIGLAACAVGYPASMSYFNKSRGVRLYYRTWGETPGYKQKRLKGELPMNAYSIQTEQQWAPFGEYRTIRQTFPTPATTYTVKGVTSEGGYDATDNGYALFTAAENAAADAKAQTKLLLKLKAQDVNLAQALAERKQTANLISTNCRRLVSAWNFLRKKDLGSALGVLNAARPSRQKLRRINRIWYGRDGRFRERASKDEFGNASSVWLEVQYGWRPLLDDIYGSAKAIAAAQEHQILQTRVACSTRLYKVVKTKPTPSPTNPTQVSYSQVTEAIIRYVVWYSQPEMPRTLLQMGFTNPALLAWELLPFSFVVDWFIPIGNYISSWDATLGLTFLKGCRSSRTNASSNGQAVGRKDSNGNVTYGITTGFKRGFWYSRTVLTSFPSPVVPSFKNPLGTEHALNAIALLVLAFSNKGPNGKPLAP